MNSMTWQQFSGEPQEKARVMTRRLLGTGNSGFIVGRTQELASRFLGTGSYFRDLSSVPSVPSVTEMLEVVSQDLKLSVTALANIFGVSRTAVYKWKDDGAMGERKLNLLTGLFRVSQRIAALNIPMVGSKLSSPLQEGKSMLLLIDEGYDLEELCRLFTGKFSNPARMESS